MIGVLLQLCAALHLSGCAEDSSPGSPSDPAPVADISAATTAALPPIGTQPVGTPTTLLVLGDSISAAYGLQREQGWVALLEAQVNRLGSEHRVINASVSGETTGGGLARLPAALQQHQPDLVIVELGGNDGLRGYPASRIRENLAAIIETAQSSGAEVVLLGMQIPPNYGPRYTEAFAGTFEKLAAEYQVPWIPGFLQDVALAGDLMQADGIHPTAAAQPLLLDAVWPTIVAFFESRRAAAALPQGPGERCPDCSPTALVVAARQSPQHACRQYTLDS